MSRRRTVIGACLALGLATVTIVGLDSGSAAAGHGDDGARTGTATAPTQPAVTVVVTATTPASELPGYNRPPIKLGDMNTPEQFILGQLYELALQQEGYTVVLTRNIGIQAGAQQALRDGSLDLYPDYLGEWNSRVAKLHRRFGTLAGSYGAGANYARRHGFVLLPPTPFSDTSGLAVTSEYARINHLRSISDLAGGTGIIVGAPLEFQMEPDGLPALRRAYRLEPGYVQNIDVGSQYGWLESGNVEAAYVGTTDPQLAAPAFRLLLDPEHVFGFGNVVPVTRPQVLAAEGPVFRRTLERVDALLTLKAMRGLNEEVEVGGHNPTAVAQQFLQGNGILPPIVFAPVPATGS